MVVRRGKPNGFGKESWGRFLRCLRVNLKFGTQVFFFPDEESKGEI
jgi:hypothetical protein